MSECPVCKGKKKMLVLTTHPFTGIQRTETLWCLCMKARYISEIYRILSYLGDTYLPFECIDQKLLLDFEDIQKNKNYIIEMTEYETFCLHVKSVIMRYHYRDPRPLIHFCKGMEILKKFYVQQEDGSSPSLSDLNRYDLLIFTLDTLENNEKLGNCVTQVVYNRIGIRKPTWIYLPKGFLLENTCEFTPQLKILLRSDQLNYESISLKSTGIETEKKKTVSQRKAENFRFK